MSSEQPTSQNRNKWMLEVAVKLGFSSLLELAKKSKIDPGHMSRIYRGINGLSDEKADGIINAIHVRNYQKGWSYLESAICLADSFNFLRNHHSYFDGRTVNVIEEEDIKRWYCNHIKSREIIQASPDERLEIIRTSLDTRKSLKNILSFLKFWEMKHDFGQFDQLKNKFNQSKPIIFPIIRRGMEEDLHVEIRDVFTEIRHMAHLCEEFKIVVEMSEWLIKVLPEDLNTQIKAETTLAWVLTSSGQQQDLYKAQNLMRKLWSKVVNYYFLREAPCEDMDVIAILCELRLRLAIRLDKRGMRPLSDEKFNMMFNQAN